MNSPVHALPARHFSAVEQTQPDLMGQLPVRHPAGKDLLQAIAAIGPHFKAIGEQFGPIDLAIMENGQYDQDWKYIHMMPEETAQAADDLRGRYYRGHARTLCWQNTADPYQRLAATSEGRGGV